MCSVVTDDWLTHRDDCLRFCQHAKIHVVKISCGSKIEEDCKKYKCVRFTKEIYNTMLEEMKWDLEYKFMQSEFGTAVGVMNNDNHDYVESSPEKDN